MLVRQRIILSLLDAAPRAAAGRTELMKWAFLMKQETDVDSGARFYDFLPYRYGPYSFALNQEMDGLLRDCYVRASGVEKRWELTDAGRLAARGLQESLRAPVRRIALEYADKSLADVIEHVYATYPWFTVNGDHKPSRRAVARARRTRKKVYTLGYEGASIDHFLDAVMRRGLQTVIDVRHNPVSRRYGFHKATLARLCSNVGLRYEHYPELGIPPEARQRAALTRNGHHTLFQSYERDTLTREASAIEAVGRTMEASASVLLCTEADPDSCHRSRLGAAVARGTNLAVEHLRL